MSTSTITEEIEVKFNSTGVEPGEIPAQGEEDLEALNSSKPKLEELQYLLMKMQEESAMLHKRMEAVEEKAAGQVEALKREQRENEPQQLQLEGRIQELEKRLINWEEKQALALAPTQKAALSLMPEEKLLDGSRPLAVVAPSAVAFIQNQEKQREPQLTTVTPMSVKSPGRNSSVPRLRKLEIMAADSNGSRRVRSHQAFGVRLILDFDEESRNASPMDYKAMVSAKSLTGNSCEVLVEAHDRISPAKTVALDMIAKALPPGTYRLQAAITLETPTRKLALDATSLDGGLLYAY